MIQFGYRSFRSVVWNDVMLYTLVKAIQKSGSRGQTQAVCKRTKR